MKRLLCVFLCVVLTAGLLTGCDNGGDTPYVPTGAGLTWDETDATGPHQSSQEEQVQELTLTCYPDRSLNPYLCTDFTNRALFPLLYQSLFHVNREYQVEPVLCKSYRRSEDMKTYTFYLENATFSDGSRLTAEDVAASLQAAKESAIYGGRFFHILQIEPSADGGVTLQLNTAMENLPVLLDIPIVKKTELEADQPVGTGPYSLETTFTGLRLRRKAYWWCSTADLVVTAPAITLVTAESPTQIRDEFEFSDLNLVCADPGSDRYVDYRCDFELWDCENGIYLYLGYNMDSDVFSDQEIRKAVTYAIDRDTIVAEHYRGFARSASLPMSPLSPYYSQKLAENYTYNSGKFTEAVSGLYQEDPVVLLVNSDDSLRLRVARDIQEMLESCGLEVKLEALKTSSYEYMLRTRQFDLYLGQTKLSPNMDLSQFFSGSGALSYGGMADVTTYALALEALANHGNYFTLHQKIMEEGLLCPILFRSYAVYATRGLLTDLTPARDNVFYYSLGKTMEQAALN